MPRGPVGALRLRERGRRPRSGAGLRGRVPVTRAALVLALILTSRPVAADVDTLTSRLALASGQPYERAAEVVREARSALDEQGQPDEALPFVLAIGARESNLSRSLEKCERFGLNGAIGVYQAERYLSALDRLCKGGLRAQTRQAVLHLTRWCRRDSWRARVACYAARKDDDALVTDRLALAAELGAP